MLTLGEVHTGLLQNSTSVTLPQSARVLSLLRGERVRHSQRPIAFAVSPDLLTGVDCRLPSRSGARTRAVGTTVSRATITGGHVVQGSTHTRVGRGEAGRRLPWSYYLSRPGAVETIGRVDRDDLVAGFVAGAGRDGGLDLGAISGRVMDAVQKAAELDHQPPFRMARTRLRWVAVTGSGAGAETPTGAGAGGGAGAGRDGQRPAVRFVVEDDTVRTVRIRADCDPSLVADLCEDLALHDWLLTTLLVIVERSRIGSGPRWQAVRQLAPAIDFLLHLWMPAARVDRSLAGLWESLERRPGFTRQWNASVDRIRDQVAISTVAMFGALTEQGAVRP